jgi:pimeloyl-ACP methyl ester carboxylesterase
MKSSTVFALSSVSFLAAMALVPGCSDDETSSSSSSSSSGSSGDDAGDGAVAIKDLGAPAIPCSDSVDSIYGDPGALPDGKGVVVKCHEDPNLSKDSLQKRLDDLGYKGTGLSSGARTLRVTFTTERGDAANTRSVSSALVYIPTDPRANDLPVVVAARGSRGQGPDCTASKRKEGLGVNDDLDRLAFSLVGHGYAVIIPDLPGYANFNAPGNPPSAYNDARDVGKATLDGTKALKQLYPKLSDKTVIVGHSQGGHSALAALSLADSYGVQGTVAGVAVYAPLWLSQRSWGALLSPGVAQSLGYTIAAQPSASAVTVWYHYTKAELQDGPGEGVKLFKPGAQAAVRQFVESQCFDPPYPQLEALGEYAYDLFEDTFRDSVGDPAAGVGACATDNAVCNKWIKRYVDDRPHLTGGAAKVPLVMLYAGNDDTIPSTRLKCAYDRLVTDGTNLTLCYEANVGGGKFQGHQGILNEKNDYVADWIANVTLGAPAPTACGAGAEAVASIKCATPPPND